MATEETATCLPDGFYRAHIRSRRNAACAKGFTLFSIVSYLYMMTNNINNYDNISILTSGYGTGVSSGRWLLSILGDMQEGLELCYNLPFINILFALVWLGLSALFVIHILQIQNPWLCFGVGALTASFPTVAATIFFSYTVHFYCFAIFLGTAGVFLALQKRWYRVFSAVLFACTLGIYQAYYPFLAALFVLALIRETLDSGITWDRVLKNAFIYLGLLAAGYVLYLGLNQIFLKVYNCTLNDYQGIDSMGKLDLRSLPRMVKKTYKHYLLLWKQDYCSISATSAIRILIFANLLLPPACLFLDWKNRSLLKNLELCVLMLLLPVAANSIIIMVPNGYIYTLMVLGLLCVFYLPVLMAEHVHRSPRTRQIAIGLAALLAVLSAADYTYQNNGNYVSLYYQNQQTENYYSILLSRVKFMEGYQEDMEIVFVGNKIQDESLHNGWDPKVFNYGGKGSSVHAAINAYSRPDYIYQFFGYDSRYATEEEMERHAAELAEMSAYPNSGSIKIIDHTVYINCR